MTQEEINSILGKVFRQIKNGELETAWEVFDEFKELLTHSYDTGGNKTQGN